MSEDENFNKQNTEENKNDGDAYALSLEHKNRNTHSILLFVFSFVTVSLSSGMVYGWPSLRRALLSSPSNNLSERSLGAIFTTGSWSTNSSRFFFGIARDRCMGTRLTTCVSLVFAALGIIGIAIFGAYSSQSTLIDSNTDGPSSSSIPLAVSMLFVGMGSGSQLCLQPVANLFDTNVQGTILSVLSGAFQVSGLVFLALTSIGGDGYGIRISFGVFAGMLLLFAGIAIVVLPRKQFVKNKREEKKNTAASVVEFGGDSKEQTVHQIDGQGGRPKDSGNSGVIIGDVVNTFAKINSRTNDTMKNNKDKSNEVKSPVSNPDGAIAIDVEYNNNMDNAHHTTAPTANLNGSTSNDRAERQAYHGDDDDDGGNILSPPSLTSSDSLKIQLKSIEYIWLVIWHSILLTSLQYYVATIGFHMEQKGDTNAKYTNFFSIIYASSAVTSPFLGKVSDAFGLGVAQGIATGLSAMSLLFLSWDSISLKAQVVGMVFYGTGRMMVFATFFANVGKRFGYTNYGTLCGFGLLMSGIVSLLQYPLIAAVVSVTDGNEKRNSIIVNVGCGISMLAMLPYCIWLGLRERREKGEIGGKV